MCGIVGFNFSDETLIKKMNDAQKHRGPDGEGIFVDEHVSLGHRRLSIIDLSDDANQPMFMNDLVIVFNGEIYNFKEIKAELQTLGRKFKTQSDTEVILHAYDEWHEECMNKFNGMWAFCIYNRSKNELFISRDRFGIKPLYYLFDNERFIFASEISALVQHQVDLSVNINALNFYLWQKYIGKDETIYNEIHKLKPGNSVRFNLSEKKLEIFKYYNVENEIEKAKNIPLQQRKSLIPVLLEKAVLKRLIADVPVGSFLSGGVDSSYISSVIAKNRSDFDVFSIGFKEDTFNEINYAKRVAAYLNVNHHYKVMDINEDLIFNVVSSLDEPFGDPSLLPTYLLSKMTKENVTVSLSGDAGDELFAGYDTYKAYQTARFIPYFFIRFMKLFTGIIRGSDKNLHYSYKLKKFADDFNKDVNLRHLNWMSQANESVRKGLLKGQYIPMKCTRKGKDLLSLQLNDFENYLCNDILKKTDTASMLNSLETRVPFLDHELVPLVLSLPKKYKLRGFKTKYILKKIAVGFIPKMIINRKKMGFSVPVSVWFKQSERMKSIIKDKNLYDHNLLDYTFSQKLLEDHLSGKADNSRILWLTFVFIIWYKSSPLNK